MSRAPGNLTMLATVKEHLRITDNTEDAYLLHLMDVADWYIADITGRDTYSFSEFPILPPPVVHAALLIIGELYENREAGGDTDSKFDRRVVEQLLVGYRQWL